MSVDPKLKYLGYLFLDIYATCFQISRPHFQTTALVKHGFYLKFRITFNKTELVVGSHSVDLGVNNSKSNSYHHIIAMQVAMHVPACCHTNAISSLAGWRMNKKGSVEIIIIVLYFHSK